MSGIARSIASSIASPISSPLAGGGGVPAFDADALDFFSRSENLGGSFDQSAINATYTEAYVKTAINAFVVGCKADAIWSKLTEVYLMSGVSFAGLMAKLKYLTVPTLTNYNFVSGDWVGAGVGAGLKGNGSTKYLDCNISPSEFATLTSVSHGFYCTSQPTTPSAQGAITTADNDSRMLIHRPYDAVVYSDIYDVTHRIFTSAPDLTGMVVASRTPGNHRVFRNGDLVVAGTGDDAGAIPTTGYSLFGVSDSEAAYRHDARDTFAFVGQGLSDANVIALSARVNALMASIGSNTY